MKKSDIGHSLVLAAALALCGCEALCAVAPPDALTVKVVDAATGTPICDATVYIAGEGIKQDMESVPDKCEYVFHNGPTGPYELLAERTGYKGAGQEITLVSGGCGVAPTSLTFQLQLQP